MLIKDNTMSKTMNKQSRNKHSMLLSTQPLHVHVYTIFFTCGAMAYISFHITIISLFFYLWPLFFVVWPTTKCSSDWSKSSHVTFIIIKCAVMKYSRDTCLVSRLSRDMDFMSRSRLSLNTCMSCPIMCLVGR